MYCDILARPCLPVVLLIRLWCGRDTIKIVTSECGSSTSTLLQHSPVQVYVVTREILLTFDAVLVSADGIIVDEFPLLTVVWQKKKYSTHWCPFVQKLNFSVSIHFSYTIRPQKHQWHHVSISDFHGAIS